MDYYWFKDYPDLQKIFILFQMEELQKPKRFKYAPLDFFIQDGPQCGIVALTLYTNNVSKEMVDKIQTAAKERGYTSNGEMFSTYNLCHLANDFTDFKAEVYEGTLDCDDIKDFLFNGGCLLVPYDSDKNHGPCLDNGRSAHWAAVSGIVETDLDIFVLAKQGKSKHVGVWRLKDLSDSNSQLREFSADRNFSNMEYILPADGIASGLCNKSILLK